VIRNPAPLGVGARSQRVAGVELGEGGRDHEIARGDTRQIVTALFCAAEFGQRQTTKHQRGMNRDWSHRPADLPKESAECDVSEIHAAVLLGDRHTQQTRFCKALHELAVGLGALALHLLQVLVRHPVLENLPRQLRHRILFFCELEIHHCSMLGEHSAPSMGTPFLHVLAPGLRAPPTVSPCSRGDPFPPWR
jgi:hypothetical protein